MPIKICTSMDEIPPGYFLADCAVSGGSLREYLQTALQTAEGRLCIHLRPTYMDFPLPCPDGKGQALNAEELHQRYDGSPCHFSKPLCTEYFTYCREHTAHVVLFDSPESLRAKFQLLQECGIPLALIDDQSLRDALVH